MGNGNIHQQIKPKYEVNIDFNEASAAWMRNKKRMKNGMYRYVCGAKRRTKAGYCRRNGRNVQRRKKFMKTPDNMFWNSGLSVQVPVMEWDRCVTHKHIPLSDC